MLTTTINRYRRIGSTAVRVALLVLVVGLATLVTRNVLVAHANTTNHKVPQNAAMESSLGIRFSRIAVVGDGGLITVNYVVLDAEKAARFQIDAVHAPVLSSEARTGGTRRVSLMRHGHNLRAGQTYYLVYQNTKGAIRAGERVTITKGKLTLAHMPVL